jgi:hypothetical protein
MGQHRPLRWPAGRILDWMDGYERRAWLAELRLHIVDLFVTGLEPTRPRRRVGSRESVRERLFASKEAIEQLLAVAGAPLEVWQDAWIRPPKRDGDRPLEQERGHPDPFAAAGRRGHSFDEQNKWLGYIEGDMEYLVALALTAYPAGSGEHWRALWTAIRLRVFLDKLRRMLWMSSR